MTILDRNAEQPESVDALVVARAQPEGVFAFCLMMQDPKYVDLYLKDGWKKQYLQFLLEREECAALPRFRHFLTSIAPKHLFAGREACGIRENQQMTIDRDELRKPLPEGAKREKIERGSLRLRRPLGK